MLVSWATVRNLDEVVFVTAQEPQINVQVMHPASHGQSTVSPVRCAATVSSHNLFTAKMLPR